MTVISVETKYFPSSRPSSPAVVVQVTCLADSYMVWVGVTEEPEEKAGGATLQGYLGKDWVVAMPPWKVRAHRMDMAGADMFAIRVYQPRELSCCGPQARTWHFR
jgi:hypothetical protein